jgi:hypothetical protein
VEKSLDAGILMPAQFADLIRRNNAIEGEMKLLMAVLEDAIRCYLRNVETDERQHRREFIEVANWFRGKEGRGPAGIFSFESLCDALGLDPHRLLARLGIMTIRDLPSRRHQMRRHRPLSSLRITRGNRQSRRAHSHVR